MTKTEPEAEAEKKSSWPHWVYINVRRLFIYLESSIKRN